MKDYNISAKPWLLLYLSCGVCAISNSAKIDTLFFDKYVPVLRKIDKNFLSVGLDSSVIQNRFHNFNMSSPKLMKIISHLSPAYLRVGGNMADRLLFVPKAENTNYSKEIDICGEEYCNYAAVKNFSMYGKDWVTLNNLTKQAGLKMVFDLNVLRRLANNSWDSTNAEQLFNFSNSHGMILDWQLGNEPNAFRHTFNYEVNASQLASDFRKLKEILKQFKRYKNSYVIGPDTTRPQIKHRESMKYLEDFLTNGRNSVDIISWHQYYFDGRTANKSNFLDPAIFDILHWQIDAVQRIQDKTNNTNKKVWLAETSSAWGGGSPKFSDKFVACFIWLDKLGIAAKRGINVVVRQSLFHGNYALISENYEPNPDYWISVLFKQLVGSLVIHCFNETSKKVRLYCHCANEDYSNRSISLVTVYGMNMQNSTAKIRIIGLVKDAELPIKIVSYTIASKGSLLGKDVYLNDKLLKLKSNNELPKFHSKIVDANPYVLIPPYSIVFWIVPVKSRICY